MALRDHEKQAVFAIMVRQVVAQDAKAAAEAEMAAAKERLEAANAQIVNIRPALALFGFDISSPKMWDAVRQEIGGELYSRAFIQAKRDADRRESATGASVDESEGKEADGDAGDAVGKQSTAGGLGEHDSAPKIRELILERVRLAGELGVKVGEVKAFIASQGIETHEKTAGMTLYRLSKDGLVRRDGRTWFYNAHEKAGSESGEGAAEGGSSSSSLFD